MCMLDYNIFHFIDSIYSPIVSLAAANSQIYFNNLLYKNINKYDNN